jgi:hypothetical protein
MILNRRVKRRWLSSRCRTTLDAWSRDSPPRDGGWTRHQENDAKLLVGADGVVAHKYVSVRATNPLRRCRTTLDAWYRDSPPREEGWTRHQENDAKPPCWRGRGGRPQVRFGESDHPVCGTAVGFAKIFLMPQPPLLMRRGISAPGRPTGTISEFRFARHNVRLKSSVAAVMVTAANTVKYIRSNEIASRPVFFSIRFFSAWTM